jgi:Ca2+-transporting ATPase
VSTVAERKDFPAYLQPADDVLAQHKVSAERGLSEQEALERLGQQGPNELRAKKPEPEWHKIIDQFKDVLVILLLAAAAISALLWIYDRETSAPYEALAILAVVLLNALMGYTQRARAENALAALGETSAAHASVLRNGTRLSILAREVVPGDIVVLEEGDIIPADGRVIEAISLQTGEAALTGESLPVSKSAAPIQTTGASLADRGNMVFSGTSITYGRGKAVITATGMKTEIGRIAGLLQAAPKQTTPLQKELDKVGRMLGVAVVAIAVVTVGTILLVEEISELSALFEVLIFGVALAVAAVPEGLPAVVTAVLSMGVQRMASRNAIVRRLSAVEALGSASVVASDKTGTLTKNEMTVRCIVTAAGCVDVSGTGYSPEGQVARRDGQPIADGHHAELTCALLIADRANNSILQQREDLWHVQGDPTEGALIAAARKAGLQADVLGARYARLREIPFSSERKLMSTLHNDAERQERLLGFTKGAPDVLLSRCTRELVGNEARPLTAGRRLEIIAGNDDLAGQALRTLGVAFCKLPKEGFRTEDYDARFEQNLIFAGLIGMIDPPRPEAQAAVARAKHAGIRPIMITGDHQRTAAIIASELGIMQNDRVLTGVELEGMTDEALERAVQDVSVYARVNPEHKLRIVKALQHGGATVAMTGDGVNDAPALKAADIGIAMGVTGTDVSKEAADMVLADDNFASIVAAVEEGRAIFANIQKFLRYLLSSNIGEVMTMFFGVLLAGVLGLAPDSAGGVVLPLLATQILWINLVTDGAPALALGVDPPDHGIMNVPPRPTNEGVITARMWAGIAFVGAIMAVGTLGVLDASLPGGLIEGDGSLQYGQTMAFTTLMLFQLFNVFNARSDERSAFRGLFVNRWLWAAVGLSLILHAAVIYVPFLQHGFSTVGLSLRDWLLCLGVASTVLWLRELSKALTRGRDGTAAATAGQVIGLPLL